MISSFTRLFSFPLPSSTQRSDACKSTVNSQISPLEEWINFDLAKPKNSSIVSKSLEKTPFFSCGFKEIESITNWDDKKFLLICTLKTLNIFWHIEAAKMFTLQRLWLLIVVASSKYSSGRKKKWNNFDVFYFRSFVGTDMNSATNDTNWILRVKDFGMNWNHFKV